MLFLSSHEREPIYFSIMATASVRIDVLFNPLGIPVSNGLFNRTLDTLILWGVALRLAYGECAQEGLNNAGTI